MLSNVITSVYVPVYKIIIGNLTSTVIAIVKVSKTCVSSCVYVRIYYQQLINR